MDGRSIEVEIVPFRKSYAKDIRRVAEKSWSYIYKEIYSNTEISNFLEINYATENLVLLEPYVEEGTISLNLAKIRGKVIGFCHFGKKEEFELLRIYLLPEWIGKGYGKELLEEGERWVKASKGTEYITRVQKNNRTGIRFYEKSGFTRDNGLDKDDEIGFRKTL